MNQFVERLPWRIAALAGLVVGGVSLAVGTDPWQSLLRVGVAFAVFGLAGMGLRALLRPGRRRRDAAGRGARRARGSDDAADERRGRDPAAERRRPWGG